MKLTHLLLFIFFVGLNKIWSQNYFQQEVNYTIKVSLNDKKHELSGKETFEYINHSPDELNYLYIHLWPNAYKNNSTTLAKDLLNRGETKFHFSKDFEKGFIDSLQFTVNGKNARWEILKDSIDICKLYLNAPLKNGERIIVSTPFHVKIPSGEFSRLGHIGQSYQITQWYPKPAVYDKNGWHPMPYLNQGEFYSEFGTFDVSITLPQNYVLGATGDRVDADKELEWMKLKANETKRIEYFNPKDMSFPPSDTVFKTIRFVQKNIHDFAWFCDKRYHILKGGIYTPYGNKEVDTWAMFTNANGNLWKKSIEYLNDALYHYSKWNGDYPYNSCTAVDGTISAGGGMEYPNITIIGDAENAFQLDLVIAHEVGHNWFYGILGSNERDHPWLDEGINSFNENRYVESIYLEKNLVGRLGNGPIGKFFDLSQYKHKKEYELLYKYTAAVNEDQAIENPSTAFTSFNYGADVYAKTALVFDYLRAYLKDDKMDNAMEAYFQEWKFKHPQPEDLKAVIQNSTGQSLDWFFDDLINSTKKMDYAIKFSYQEPNGAWKVGVKNSGEINAPLFLQAFNYNDNLMADMTFDGFSGREILSIPPIDSVKYFKIDYYEDMLDMNRNNNTLKTKGLFKRVEPLRLQFLGSLDNPEKTQLFYSPVVGWNNYNKWMVGMAFHNITLPQKKFEYVLMPMYSTQTKNLTGYANTTLNLYPKNRLFQHLAIGASAKQYAYTISPIELGFLKISPYVNIKFKKKIATSPYTHQLKLRNINIQEELLKTTVELTSSGNTISYSSSNATRIFNDISYVFEKEDVLKPYTLKLNVLQGENIFKTSFTANYSIKFETKNKGIDIRFFAGTFIGTSTADAGPYRFRLSGQRGYQDYLYDDIFLGRTETTGMLANQFTETDGAFKFYSPIGQSSKWLTTLNLKSSLGNMKLPVNLYADLGIAEYDGRLNQTLLYNAGLSLTLLKNICEIYFPIFMSEDFTTYKETNGLSYAETIRFTLNLKLMNPLESLKNIDL